MCRERADPFLRASVGPGMPPEGWKTALGVLLT